MSGIIRKEFAYLDAVVGIILVTLGSLAFTGVLPYSSLTQGIFLTLGSCSLVPAFIKMIHDVTAACRNKKTEEFFDRDKNPIFDKMEFLEDSTDSESAS